MDKVYPIAKPGTEIATGIPAAWQSLNRANRASI
jgi:hypothetical protein